MINSPILDTAIGLVFILLLYSLLATSINEAIATFFGLRARMLKKGIIEGMLSDSKHEEWILDRDLNKIKNVFKDVVFLIVGYRPQKKEKLGHKFYNHPLIKNYGSNSRYNTPSYLSRNNFSTILIEILKDYWNDHFENIRTFFSEEFKEKNINQENLPTITKIHYLIKYLSSEEGKNLKEKFKEENIHIDQETLQILAIYLEKSYQNLDVFTNQLETWYDQSMDRVSGWYKRQVQFTLFFIGLFLAIAFNVDMISIAGKLSTDKDARDKLVELAIRSAEELKKEPLIVNSRIAKDSLKKKELDSMSLSEYKNKISEIEKQLYRRVKESNNLMAIGWGDYGLVKDSATTVRMYACELQKIKKGLTIDFKNTSTKDTLRIKNQIALEKLYANHWVKFKLSYIISNFYKGKRLLGYAILAFGVCLGAPFWFDLLQKLIKLRAAGKKEDSEKVANNTKSASSIQVIVNNSDNSDAVG